MSVAIGSYTTAQVVALATDNTGRWTVYAGTAPETATAPFVSVYLEAPIKAAEAVSVDDLGVFRPRWRFNLFAASVDQVRWLQGELLAKSWPNTMIEQVGNVTLDPQEQPDLYYATIVMRQYDVSDR